MHRVAILGDDATALAATRACELADMAEVARFDSRPRHNTWLPPAHTLPANLTRILQALGIGDTLVATAHAPDREQVRLARSGYLVAELPLGDFIADRYGAPHLNIEDAALLAALGTQTDAAHTAELATLEAEYDVVLVTGDQGDQGDQHHQTHHAWLDRQPIDTPERANVTWLRPGQQAQQFSTATHAHLIIVSSADAQPRPDDWHPSLQAAIERALDGGSHPLSLTGEIREHWRAGHTGYLGDACRRASPWHRESRLLGLEDAWVVSRMLENYEEDIGDGLDSYVRYRRPRTRKVAAAEAEIRMHIERTSPPRRALRHIGTAASARFLPEIAMQRLDWLYQYDCIRGFR